MALIHTVINVMNIGKVSSFDPSVHHISSFSQLHKLDTLPAQGITEVEFWNLFAKCEACSNFMTKRSIPYHLCPPGQLLRFVVYCQ